MKAGGGSTPRDTYGTPTRTGRTGYLGATNQDIRKSNEEHDLPLLAYGGVSERGETLHDRFISPPC